MKIRVMSHVWSVADDPNDIQKLKQFFMYPHKDWRRDDDDELKCTISYRSIVGKTGWFFTGLLSLVKEQFLPEIEYEFTANRIDVEIPRYINGVQLDPHQLRIIKYATSFHRGILESPTGSGKTLAIVGVIKALQHPNTLFICESKDIFTQTYTTFLKSGIGTVGRMGAGKKEIGQQITVATIQTLRNLDEEQLQEIFRYTKCIIVDEAHHVHASTYLKVLKHIRAPFRLGFTATPKKMEDNEEGRYFKATGILGPIIYTVGISEAPKRLVKPILRMIDIDDGHSKQYENQEWAFVYEYGIVKNLMRNQRIIGVARYYMRRGKSVLIAVKHIEHGKLLQQLYPKLPFVQGEDSQEVRDQVKEHVQKGSHAAIATGIFKEGVDLPKLDVIIVAGAGKSKIATIQQAGRALRRVPGKEVGIIVDFWDRHAGFLINHSRIRYKHYKSILKVVEI